MVFFTINWQVYSWKYYKLLPEQESIKKKKKKKKLGNIQKTYVVEFPLNTNAQIQSTAYYQTKTSTTGTFLKFPEECLQ